MASETRRRARARGFQKERELIRRLWEEGFACIRAPASGSKVRRSVQPDVVAIRNDVVFVMEVKTRRWGRAIYIEREKIEKLLEWSRRAGKSSVPLVAVYIGRNSGWRFAKVDELQQTESGYFKVKVDDLSRLYDINALKALSDKSRKITEYF